VGASDHCGEASEKFINDVCLAYTGAEGSESEDMTPHSVPPVDINKADKLPGQRYNLNTDVLPIIRHVCADSVSTNNIQVQGLF